MPLEHLDVTPTAAMLTFDRSRSKLTGLELAVKYAIVLVAAISRV